MRRARIYIAGPLSKGDRLANVEKAKAVAVELVKLGFAPLCPHLTNYLDGTDSLGHQTWMDVDLPWVEVSDGLLRIPGESKGADLEVARAREYGVPVYWSINGLLEIPPRIGDARYERLLKEMWHLHSKKAADYGTDADLFSNIRASEEIGIPAWKGAFLRAKDKVKRINAYCLNGSLANEGVEDSFMDNAAYNLIALLLFREAKLQGGGNGCAQETASRVGGARHERHPLRQEDGDIQSGHICRADGPPGGKAQGDS